MDTPNAKLVGPKAFGVIVGLTGLFWLVMGSFLRAFVPAEDPVTLWIVALFGATPMAGTFFLAAIMFTTTLVDQRRRKRGA
ncbi:MAG: hypothetical protein ACFE0O_04850 [Opitutales bacterium]